MSDQETPVQESVSLITIVAILLAVVCYLAALNDVPLLAPGLLWLATALYGAFPALARLPGAQIPMLASSAAVGIGFFIVTIPFAGLLAQAFSQAGVGGIDRQTRQLRRQRQRSRNRQRQRDRFRAE